MPSLPYAKGWIVALALMAPASTLAADPPEIAWHDWSDEIFQRAAREHRFVLLDLEAVWCHWCHVMDERTYRDAAVRAEIAESFIAARVDEDSRPDLFERYKYYGWPATIIFGPDGTERVKIAGYYGAKLFSGILQGALGTPARAEAIADPPTTPAARLPDDTRAAWTKLFDGSYDRANGGWGRGYKFIDYHAIAYALDRDSAGDAEAATRARATLDHALNLIDPVAGGAYQYSDEADWKSPHFEKIMPIQVTYLRAYSEAFARWRDPRYRRAADAVARYLGDVLRAPAGGFFVSQDADLNGEVDGHRYYALDEGQRRKLGAPRLDTHRYARETGMAIMALAAYHDATGDARSLAMASAAADWALAERALPDGGFRHDEADRYGPFLGDSLAMAEAFLALYRSSGERRWLSAARRCADFIQAHFMDAAHGAMAATPPISPGPRPPLPIEGNIDGARFFNILSAVTGEPAYRRVAERILGYLGSPAVKPTIELLPGALLLDRELSREPVHITVVGPKRDTVAAELFAAGLAYPVAYKRVDWWDRDEGPLPNNDVEFPDRPEVAAYACTQNTCSLPLSRAEELAPALDRIAHRAAIPMGG